MLARMPVTKPDRDLHLDRRVSSPFLQHFAAGGFAHSLVHYARHAPFPLDLQFRAHPYSGEEFAQLYVGTTSVLKLNHLQSGKLRFSAAESWQARAGADRAWSSSASPDAWRRRWPDVERYLDDVIPLATRSHGVKEGLVHSAASCLQTPERQYVDRETVIAFRNSAVQKAFHDQARALVLDVAARVRGVKGKVPTSFGDELDLLAVEGTDRLVAIEVKPKDVGSIRWAPLQVTMYAELLRHWLDAWAGTGVPGQVLSGMRQQRVDVGLLDDAGHPLVPDLRVVPVVAVQRGSRPALLDEMRLVCEALDAAGHEVPALYEIDLAGRLTPLPT